MDKLNEDWYCPTCEDYVSGESVTFEEVHVICGTFIGEAWQKTKAALEQRVEGLEDALEHCGYDATDCIDCGGPPHNEWCRFWKLRDFIPSLFYLAAEEEA